MRKHQRIIGGVPSELPARFLPINAVLLGQQGEKGVQSGAVEFGGIELDSGAEQSSAAEESNSLPLALSFLSLAFTSLSCSVSLLSSLMRCS